jgi:PAS domain-containing protein
MIPVSAEEVARSWPLSEQSFHFDLGHVLNCAVTDVIEPRQIGKLGIHHAGLWECNLADQTLIWSGGVYDIFGLGRGSRITRGQAISHYDQDSRTRLERLRTYAIRHRRGFTIDVSIFAQTIEEVRRVRIIAAPECDSEQVVRLHGVKLII